MNSIDSWPSLPLAEWRDTCDTLHMWAQIVGKVRMQLSSPLNHWWATTFYVNARGLTTSPIPFGNRVFEIQFDFVVVDNGFSETLEAVSQALIWFND